MSSEALERQVLRAVPTIIYAFDLSQTRTLYQNHKLSSYLGYPEQREASIFKEWQAFMHPADLARFSAHLDRLAAMQSGAVIGWGCRLKSSDGKWRHFLNRETLLPPKDGERIVVGVASDVTERKEAEEQKDLLLGELQHRSQNFGAMIGAIARQTRPASADKALEAFDNLASRLQTLVAAGESILTGYGRRAPIGSIIERALSPLVGPIGERVRLNSDLSILLEEAQAGSIALVTHELATNALKYGALSAPGGQIDITASKADDGRTISLVWAEREGPSVAAPTRSGFGSRVLKSAVRNGRVNLQYLPDGFRYELDFESA